MNNGPDDVRDVSEPTVEGEISEPAMEALLRAEFRESREPLALPEGFAERVLARAAAEQAMAGLPLAGPGEPVKGKVLAFPRRAVWRVVAGGALAASVLAGTFGLELERRHREAAGEASRTAQERVVANQQFEQASRITDAALEHTRKQLQRAGVFEDEGR